MAGFGRSLRLGLLTLAGTLAAPLAAQPAPRKTVPIVLPEPQAPARPLHGPVLPDGTPERYTVFDPSVPLIDFNAALQQAYWTNPDLLAARARLRATDFRLPQARAGYGPKLSYSVAHGWQRTNQEQVFGGYNATTGWSTTASAVLTQPLYTFGRNVAAERGARAQIDFERASLRFSEARVLLESITAYVSVLRDREGVRIAQENLDLLTRELIDTRTRFRLREVTSTDLQQVETRYEFGQAQVLTAKNAAASSDAQFLVVIGSPAGELAPPRPLELPANSLEAAYTVAQLQSPLLAAAHAREQSSRAQGDIAKADLLPRVDLRGRADVGSTPLAGNTLRQTELRGEVVVSGPIFESGLRRARLGEAEAANDADWRLVDAALRDLKGEVADAWNEWRAQAAAAVRLQASITSAQAAYDGAVLQERAGLRTTLDVLDLARDLLSARTGQNNAAASAYLAKARLLAALGALEGGALFPDDPGYDPLRHFEQVSKMSDIPLLTNAVRGLDTATTSDPRRRPLRDASAQVGVDGVDVLPPEDVIAQ